MSHSRNVCWYFNEGKCRFGDRCRYQHVPCEENVSRGPTSPSLKSKGSNDYQQNFHSSKTNRPYKNLDEDIFHEIKNIVTVELNEWEHGNMWKLSSFGPFKGAASFPGFEDVSAEELRWASYQAKSPQDKSYLDMCITALFTKFQKRKLMLLHPDETILQILKELYLGQSIPNLGDSQELTSFLKFVSTSAPSSKVASTFKFCIDTPTEKSTYSDQELEKNIPPSASSECFNKNAPNTNKQTVSSLKDMNKNVSTVADASSSVSSDVYTSLENLTQQEKEQFFAHKFDLSKIPVRPPPKELC